jgi:gliding motility-associated-like protein
MQRFTSFNIYTLLLCYPLLLTDSLVHRPLKPHSIHNFYNSRSLRSNYTDTSISYEACDTSAFRITYQAAGSSWLLNAKSLHDDEMIGVGQVSTGNSNDGWLLKTDRYGNVLWSMDYGSSQNDFLQGVIHTSDGGFLAVGSVQNPGPTPTGVSGYGWALKTDASGKVIWSYKLNIAPSQIQRACETKDGYVLIASINLPGASSGIIIIKINNNGSLQWMKEYSSGTSDAGYDIKQTTDGNFVISGFVFGLGAGSHDGLLMKVSAKDGSLLWFKTYGSTGDDVIDCFDEDNQGNLYLSLYWGVDNEVSIVKTDANGNIIWSKLYSTSFPSSRGNAIQVTSSGDIILSFMDVTRHTGGGAIKLNSAGIPEWAYDYHPSGGDLYAQYTMQELTSHNGFLVAGTASIGSTGNFEGYLAKTDTNGKAGTCAIKAIQITPTDFTPVVQDQKWSDSSSPTDWEQVQITSQPLPITKNYICPQCCVSSNTTIDTAICEGGAYLLPNDSIVNQAGIYAVKFTSYTGCDSIITVHLTVNPTYHITVEDSICPHEKYTLPDGRIVDSAGDYASSLSTSTGCDSTIITHLSYKSPVFILYEDSICSGATLTLPNGQQINQAGTYQITLPSTTGCDTLAIYHVLLQSPPAIHLGSDTCLILGQTLLLDPGQGYPQYEWQDGSTQPTMTVSMPDLYWVKVSNECGSVSDSIKVTMNCLPRIFISSAFTPNGDGMNDIFRILNVHGQKLIMFNVYNRWGQMVFHTTNISQGWDGMYNGMPAEQGAYIYLVKIINLAGKQKVYKGSVLLIR